METFNEDPKPGRLVLPLVLIGMIATTYTFINRVAENNNLEIEPTVEVVTEEVDEEPTTEDTTTTTTTTLPDEVISYLEEISSEKIQTIDLATKDLGLCSCRNVSLPNKSYLNCLNVLAIKFECEL